MNMILLQAPAKANAMMKKSGLQLQWVPKIRCLAGLTGRRALLHSDNNCDSGEGANQWPGGCLKKKGKRILERGDRLSTLLPVNCFASSRTGLACRA
jgi:hypothetical protein